MSIYLQSLNPTLKTRDMLLVLTERMMEKAAVDDKITDFECIT